MYPSPNYLNLESQLYSTITLHKEMIFDNVEDGFHYEMFERVIYDSTNRVIDLTESIHHVLQKGYRDQTHFQIKIFDPLIQDYKILIQLPHQRCITLGQQFLQADVLLFRIQAINQQQESDQQQQFQSLVLAEQEIYGSAGVEQKKRRKTIRQILQLVNHWRKLYFQYNCKITLQEGAELMNLSKRSLELYIQTVKMGERYQYPFSLNLDKNMADLKKYIKQKSQMKKIQEMQMLNQLKKYYK